MMNLLHKAYGLAVAGLIIGSATSFVGAQPAAWQPPSNGKYLQRVKALFEGTYRIVSPTIRQQHFTGMQGIFGDIDVFQISKNETCEPAGCYYAVFSADIGELPILTDCKLDRTFFAHLHHPDGSKFFVIEFSCGSTFTYIQISKDHYWVNSTQTKR